MTDKEKLAELIYNNSSRLVEEEAKNLAKRLISYGVTVQETVDAAPVVHGRWEKFGYDLRCSVCGVYQSGFYIGMTNYCPHCGARMDGDEDA